MMRWFVSVVSAAILSLSGGACWAQASAAEPADAILVLDASGSMWAQVDGEARITIAKRVVNQLLDELPAGTRLGLMAYGHRRKGDCKDIELIAPVGAERDALRRAVDGLSPIGKTPMTDAVLQAAGVLKYTEDRATVILVSDGEETCHADPCAAMAELARLGVDLKVHTVGFGLDAGSAGLAQLQCMAEATGGRFFATHDAAELGAALSTIRAVEAAPAAPKEMRLELVATAQQDGPVIDQGLVWTVTRQDGAEAFRSDPAGSVSTQLAPGRYRVQVLRLRDEAGAEGDLVMGEANQRLVLPIVVEYQASVQGPAQAVAGSKIEVEWSGPEQAGDYIAILAPGQSPRYPNEQTPITAGNPLSVQVPSEPGDYRILYVMAEGHAAVAEQAFTVTQAESFVRGPESAVAGSKIEVEWGGPGYEADYIAIVAPGQSPRYPSEETPIKAGNPLSVQVPSVPGEYRILYVMKHGHEPIAEQPLTVTEAESFVRGPASAVAGSKIEVEWGGPGYEADYIAIVAPGQSPRYPSEETPIKAGNPLSVQVPSVPGEYRILYVIKHGHEPIAEQPLTVTEAESFVHGPASAVAGSKIEVEWGGPGYEADYIAIVAPGQSPRYPSEETPIKAGNPLSVQVPSEPGDYRILYVMKHGHRPVSEQALRVDDVGASLTGPATVLAGETLGVAWTGPAYEGDYIAIGIPGESPRYPKVEVKVAAGSPLDIRAPDKPGEYQLMYVMRHGHRLLKSQPLTVRAK